MSLAKEQKLEIHRRNLEKYEQSGDADLVAIQKRLIARIEAE